MAKNLPEGVFSLRLHPYSGCGPIDLIDAGTLAGCRHRAAREIRYHRTIREYPVTTLEPGRAWELESDPDGKHLISDREGILRIRDVNKKCRECGDQVNVEFMSDGLCDSCGESFNNSDYDPDEHID
jgi:hypothetical protein